MEVPWKVKLHAATAAAEHALHRLVSFKPHKPRVVAWLYIDARHNVRGIAHAVAKKTKAKDANGTWICIHRYPILGDQLFMRLTKAELNKPPIKPVALDPSELAENMLPPQNDEWAAKFAGPLGDWPDVDRQVRAQIAALAALVKHDSDWLKVNVYA